MKNILEKLNPPQREAVTTTEGPVLIIAGAGSGKTRALTHRVAYLILEKKINPRQILAVTFTNKAAGEMKERISELLRGEEGKKHDIPTVGTFHSVCVRILRREIEKIGIKSSFNILDAQDQLSVAKKTMKELGVNIDQFKPKGILGEISNAKNELIDAELFASRVGGYWEEMVSKIYTAYQKKLQEQNALDFDDIILFTVKIFQKYPEVLAKYQNFFRYIMVDEYQDTNHAQYTLIKILSEKNKNLCVVGDDWQCLPPETRISVSPEKTESIQKISKNNKIVSASGQGEICEQAVTGQKKTKFQGELVKITTESGESLLATPNHILFSKLAMESGFFYVYLMYKKEMGYRIGQTKGARISKSNFFSVGLCVRANQERAEKMWILKVCQTREEAAYWEQYLSVYYGIPTLVFSCAGRNMKFEQKWIDKIFDEIDTRERAKKMFRDFSLFFEYPHHAPQSTIRNGIGRISINLTLFSDRRKSLRNNWGMHRLSLNSMNQEAKIILEKNGFKTRKGKFNDWRLEIARLDYSQMEEILSKIKKLLPEANFFQKALLTKSKRFDFQPASHIRETMLVPILKQEKIVEEKVIKVEKVKYAGPVYDLNVANVHNYIANNFVVHNSIYGWRGANIQNILNFEKDYPSAKVVMLEQNYRSTQNILDAAYGVISKNINRKDKKVWTENQGGHLLTSFEAMDEKEEAAFLINEIAGLKKDKGVSFSDFVVLYRTNAQSRIIEEAMLRASIPYRIIGGLKFYQRKEIKDIIAYLRVVQNFTSEVSLERIINCPKRNIGPSSFSKWIAFSKNKNTDPISAGLLIDPSSGLPTSKINTVKKFSQFIVHSKKKLEKMRLTDFIEFISEESGYQKFLLDGTEEGQVRLENVRELLSVAKKYDEYLGEEGLDLFLEEVALIADTDNINQTDDSVHLMTLHSAKGLEFQYVFIVGLEEGILPHSRSLLSPQEMEEERRLMYVGITRAKSKVYLLFTAERNIFGSTQINSPSRFLEDIPESLIESPDTDKKTENFPEMNETYKKSDFAVPRFKDGEHVQHEAFGEGMIVASQGDILTVAFKKAGLKKLSASIAPLRKIE
jgi:DNA helicase II / ATP-dependent DNA helicase PcrA